MRKLKGVLVFSLFAVLLAACSSAPTSTQVQTQASAPEPTEITSYYVCANGNDSNAGTSESAPFKTLAKAIEMAAKTTIKKITVIGTFSISKETRVYINTGSKEILITGKPGAAENEKAVLKGTGTLLILEDDSNIKLEYITLQGETGPDDEGSRGIWVEEDATLTLGRDAVLTQFYMDDLGMGIFLEGGTLFMIENALITGNKGFIGGGLIINGGNAIMQDEASITNNIAIEKDFGGGGVAVVEGGTLTMKGNSSISGNKAERGGGVFIDNGTLIMEDDATIKNNESTERGEGFGGGGVAVLGYGTITMRGSSSISGNKAVSGGGVHVNRGTLIMEDNTTIKNNESTGSIINGGGGICVFYGEAILKDNALVTENKANFGGGVYIKFTESLEFVGGSISDFDDDFGYTFQTGSIRGNFVVPVTGFRNNQGSDVFRNGG